MSRDAADTADTVDMADPEAMARAYMDGRLLSTRDVHAPSADDAGWEALDSDPMDGHAPDCTGMTCCGRPSCEPHTEDCAQGADPADPVDTVRAHVDGLHTGALDAACPVCAYAGGSVALCGGCGRPSPYSVCWSCMVRRV